MVFSSGRLGSTRLPNKLALSVSGNQTLTHIVMYKLRRLREQGIRTFFAGGGPFFEQVARNMGVDYVRRSPESVESNGPTTQVFGFLRDVKDQLGYEPETVCYVNPCMPFVSVSTVLDFIHWNEPPAFTVVRQANYFVDARYAPVNFPPDVNTLDTQHVEPLYAFAHALYLYKPAYLFEHGRYWDWRDVHYVELAGGKLAAMDVDTREDLAMVRRLWQS